MIDLFKLLRVVSTNQFHTHRREDSHVFLELVNRRNRVARRTTISTVGKRKAIGIAEDIFGAHAVRRFAITGFAAVNQKQKRKKQSDGGDSKIFHFATVGWIQVCSHSNSWSNPLRRIPVLTVGRRAIEKKQPELH